MFKFVHAADLHIDSRLEGLGQYEGAPADRIRVATRDAVQNLVRLAIEEGARFVVFAGDVYDGDWKDYNTGLFWSSQLARLSQRGIQSFVVHGNHDAESRITRRLPLPEGTKVFAAAHPETFEIADLGVAIHGQSFDQRDVTRDLSAGYPPPIPDLFNIGVLHTAATGRAGHQLYAPCSVEDLKAKGYDYWALGHVHTREVLCESPFVVFPGNTQGRHARELGPKGCSLVTVGGGRVLSVEHRDLDVVRWQVVSIDASRAESMDDVLDVVRLHLAEAREQAGERLLAVRVAVVGPSRAHAELARAREGLTHDIRAVANEIQDVWLEKVVLQTVASGEPFARGDEVIQSLVLSLDAMKGDPAVRDLTEQIVGELHAKLAKIPGLSLPDGPLGAQAIDVALGEAVELLRARLGRPVP
jgi:DNA repair protein SbcD/Mre11